MPIFHELIGFTDTQKQLRLTASLKSYKRAFNRERFVVTVESIESDGVEEMFDVRIPGLNAFDASGFLRPQLIVRRPS